MADIYDRLKPHGFDQAFVRDVVLPDWWDDALASNPTERSIAEASISSRLGFTISDLRAATPLPALPVNNFRLRRFKASAKAEEHCAGVLVALQAGKFLAHGCKCKTKFVGQRDAAALRTHIINSGRLVNLASLLEVAKAGGIVVGHLDGRRLPKASKKFAGIAAFWSDCPVVMLGSARDGPPWLAYHLAHELGHIFLGHVKAGDQPLVDMDLERADDSDQEKAADRFANVLISGREDPGFKVTWGLTGPKLANAATTFGQANKIDPGACALMYAQSADRWGAGAKALDALGQSSGAHDIIRKHVRETVDVDGLSDANQHFLSSLGVIES